MHSLTSIPPATRSATSFGSRNEADLAFPSGKGPPASAMHQAKHSRFFCSSNRTPPSTARMSASGWLGRSEATRFRAPASVSASEKGWSDTPEGAATPSALANSPVGKTLSIARCAASTFTGFRDATTHCLSGPAMRSGPPALRRPLHHQGAQRENGGGNPGGEWEHGFSLRKMDKKNAAPLVSPPARPRAFQDPCCRVRAFSMRGLSCFFSARTFSMLKMNGM